MTSVVCAVCLLCHTRALLLLRYKTKNKIPYLPTPHKARMLAKSAVEMWKPQRASGYMNVWLERVYDVLLQLHRVSHKTKYRKPSFSLFHECRAPCVWGTNFIPADLKCSPGAYILNLVGNGVRYGE